MPHQRRLGTIYKGMIIEIDLESIEFKLSGLISDSVDRKLLLCNINLDFKLTKFILKFTQSVMVAKIS